MGHSSLLGIDRAPGEPAGRDTADLGPSDTSDSGSDVAGIEDTDQNDPAVPLDVALREDGQRSFTSADVVGGPGSDSSGTGERRAAGGDAGIREAADISVDRIVEPHFEVDEDEDEDPDLAFLDTAEVGDPFEDEGEDEDDAEADLDTPVDERPRSARAQAPAPGRPNPQPDPPHPATPGEDDDEDVDDEGDAEIRQPGRS